jgi:hypothetical protein
MQRGEERIFHVAVHGKTSASAQCGQGWRFGAVLIQNCIVLHHTRLTHHPVIPVSAHSLLSSPAMLLPKALQLSGPTLAATLPRGTHLPHGFNAPCPGRAVEHALHLQAQGLHL